MRAPNSLTHNEIYRFACFRLNVPERTLECNGKPVSLSPKAWEVLRVLVAHQGHIVEKKILMDEVWPETFVEENNLAFNVSVVRKVLGENAAEPKFIETVPKRGYRFIAPVEQESPEAIRAASENLGGREEVVESPATLASVHSERPPWSRKLLTAAALGGTALVALVALLHASHPKLSGEDTILLSGFENDTGERVFDGTLDRGLAIELEQSPFLSL